MVLVVKVENVLINMTMERKVIKRLSNTSYWSDGVGLWLKPNVGGEFREKDVVARDGRKWHKDVGFLDSYFKEAFSEIPEIRFVRASPKVIEEKRVEEVIVKPILEPKVEKVVVESTGVKTRKRKLSEEDRVMVVEDYKRGVSSRELSRHYGISYSMVLRYVRKSGVEYRAVSGRKKAPTS